MIVQRDNSHGDEGAGAADELYHVLVRRGRHVLAIYLQHHHHPRYYTHSDLTHLTYNTQITN